MRSRKYRVMTTLGWGSNRLIRLALRAGVAVRYRATERIAAINDWPIPARPAG